MKLGNIVKYLSIIIISTLILFNTGCKESEPGSIAVCFLTKVSVLNNGTATQTFDLSYENNILSQITQGNDSTSTYEYDNYGRIDRVTNYVNGAKKSGIQYTYNGNVATASYGKFSNVGVWTPDDWNEVYEFDTDGFLLKKEIHTKNDSSIWVIESYYLYEWSNRNMSQKEHWVLNTESGDYDKYSTTTYQYDDKNNPFSSAQILIYGEYTKNNATIEETYLTENNVYSRIEYIYTYDQQNNPITGVATDLFGNTIDTKYEYNCL